MLLTVQRRIRSLVVFFFFNDTATTEIYTLSLHDALPICFLKRQRCGVRSEGLHCSHACRDRKSTRLNSSHTVISYAVFCLKKKTLRPPSLDQIHLKRYVTNIAILQRPKPVQAIATHTNSG